MCFCMKDSPSKTIECCFCKQDYHTACEQLCDQDLDQIVNFYCTKCEVSHGMATTYAVTSHPNLEESHQVKSIVDHKPSKSGYDYLVLWINYSMRDATWEPETNLVGCPILLERYKRKYNLSQNTEALTSTQNGIEPDNCHPSSVRDSSIVSSSHDSMRDNVLEHVNEHYYARKDYMSTNLLGAPTDMPCTCQNSAKVCSEVLKVLAKFASTYSKREEDSRLIVGCLASDSFKNDGITLIPHFDNIFIVLYLCKHDLGFILDCNNTFLCNRSVRKTFQQRLKFRLFCPKFIKRKSLNNLHTVAAIVVTLWKDYHRNEVSWPELSITSRTINQLIKLT